MNGKEWVRFPLDTPTNYIMNNPPMFNLSHDQKWFLLIASIVGAIIISLSYLGHKYPDPPKTPEQIASEINLKEESKRNGLYQDCLRTIDAYDKAKGSEEKCYLAAYGEEKK